MAASVPAQIELTGTKRKSDGVETSGVQDAWIKAPLFLTKTFDMINECDDEVAGWNEKGDMFIVKNAQKLSQIYIFRYFGHKNFSSWTRQLNFYGFRKVFPESFIQKVNDGQGANTEVTDKHVSFFHELFRRGRPDLLQQIRRTPVKRAKKPAVAAVQEENAEELKRRVVTLENRLSILSKEMNTKISDITSAFEARIAKLERDKEARDQKPAAAAVVEGGTASLAAVAAAARLNTSSPTPTADIYNFVVNRLNLSPSNDSIIESMDGSPAAAPKVVKLKPGDVPAPPLLPNQKPCTDEK